MLTSLYDLCTLNIASKASVIFLALDIMEKYKRIIFAIFGCIYWILI